MLADVLVFEDWSGVAGSEFNWYLLGQGGRATLCSESWLSISGGETLTTQYCRSRELQV